MEARDVVSPEPFKEPPSMVSGHREKCKLPINDVLVVIGEGRAVVIIEHLTFSRGKKHPKLCSIEVG